MVAKGSWCGFLFCFVIVSITAGILIVFGISFYTYLLTTFLIGITQDKCGSLNGLWCKAMLQSVRAG